MRIINPLPTFSPSPAAPTPSAPDRENVAALERSVQSMRVTLARLEERLGQLESAPAPVTAPEPVAPVSTLGRAIPAAPTPIPVAQVNWDPEMVRKNLLWKMWQYLNDEERPDQAV